MSAKPKRAIKKTTTNYPEKWYELGKSAEAENDIQQAKAYYEKAVSADPTFIQAIYKIASICQKENEFDTAIYWLKNVITLNPNIAQVHNALGLAYRKIAAFEQALTSFRTALKIDPQLVEAYNNMGIVFKEMGKYSQAFKCYQKAVEVNPNYAEAYYNNANMAHDKGELNTAIYYYQKALKANSRFTKAFNNLGCVFQYQGKYNEALACFEQAIQVAPDNMATLYNLSSLYRISGQLRKAVACTEKILQLRPDDYKACVFYYEQLRDICDWNKLEHFSEKLDYLTQKALRLGKKLEESPFLNMSRSQNMAENLAVAKMWSEEIDQSIPDGEKFSNHFSLRNCPDKITIGYLSNGFQKHPATILMCDMFKYHDRQKFRIHGYAYGKNKSNNYRKRIEEQCDLFLDVQNLDDAAIAKRIYSDQCDIVIDIKGYTEGNRIRIFAYRPAPIQVRFLGIPGTTGAIFFDYLLTDRIVTPPEFSPFYTEKFAYLPDCYQVNSLPIEADAAIPLRSDEGLPEDVFIFCCFCTSYKINADIFKTWMNILHRVPGSILWLLEDTAEFRKNILEEVHRHGISVDRVIFASRCNHERHLNRLQLADLALDTTIVSGAATTSDALWAGVPVLTLQGKHFGSRMSASILHSIQLDQLVASTLDQYENIAARLAEDRGELDFLKSRLQREMLCETLFNTKQYVKNLEEIFQVMWRRYTDGQPVDLIDIRDSGTIR